MKLALARTFVKAVAARDLEAAEDLLDPDVETLTPRGTLRGIAACRRVLRKASGDEQFAVEQTEPDFEEIEGEIVARTHEIARWRETGEIAYETILSPSSVRRTAKSRSRTAPKAKPLEKSVLPTPGSSCRR